MPKKNEEGMNIYRSFFWLIKYIILSFLLDSRYFYLLQTPRLCVYVYMGNDPLRLIGTKYHIGFFFSILSEWWNSMYLFIYTYEFGNLIWINHAQYECA